MTGGWNIVIFIGAACILGTQAITDDDDNVVFPMIDCLLGCSPGQLINTVSVSRVNNSLDSILGLSLNNRRVAIGISSVNNKPLENPRWFIEEGDMAALPPDEVPQGRSTILRFEKSGSITKSGTKGVISYDISGTDVRVVTMWSLTGDGDNNQFLVQALTTERAVDRDLYLNMESLSQPATYGDDFTLLTNNGVTVESHMTPTNKGKLIVRVDSSEMT